MACGGLTAALAMLHLAAGGPTVIGTEVPFYPFTQFDETGQITGMDREIADEVCARAALTCTWVATQFDGLIPGVTDGTYDIIMGGIAVTDARAKLVDFSISYTESASDSSYLGRPGAPAVDDAMIAVQSGTIHAQHLADTGRRYTLYPNEAAVLQALVDGKADLALGSFNAEPLGQIMATNGFDWLYSENIPDNGTAMAVCKGNTALLQKLDAALAAMIADGTLDEILSRW